MCFRFFIFFVIHVAAASENDHTNQKLSVTVAHIERQTILMSSKQAVSRDFKPRRNTAYTCHFYSLFIVEIAAEKH